jgi:HK97 family phage major capsid protein
VSEFAERIVEEAERQADEAWRELGRAERAAQWWTERNRRPSRAEAWSDVGIDPRDQSAQEIFLREGTPYAPDSDHSYFRDLIVDQLARQAAQGTVPIRDQTLATTLVTAAGGTEQARARLSTLEARDVTSADPGAGPFLGPGYLGERFNTAARAEGSLAAALGLMPLPRGVKRIDIPRFDTGASAGVQASEGAAVSQTDVDGGSQAGNIAPVSGRQTLSLQALEYPEPGFDVVLARELGAAIGTAIDTQLVSGSNAAGLQTLGLANVTGIKTVTWTDASPTSQEFVGQCWKAYNEIAGSGEGIADPDAYLTVVHPRRLAWLRHNPQASQSIAPEVPGRLIACAGLRTNLGGGTEDEAFVIVADELPAFASQLRLIVDVESVSGTLQVRLVAYRMIGSGFGRAPAAICRISGTGMVAPAL